MIPADLGPSTWTWPSLADLRLVVVVLAGWGLLGRWVAARLERRSWPGVMRRQGCAADRDGGGGALLSFGEMEAATSDQVRRRLVATAAVRSVAAGFAGRGCQSRRRQPDSALARRSLAHTARCFVCLVEGGGDRRNFAADAAAGTSLPL